MQINCINCSKTFEVDDSLIPEKGRLLQCGQCNYQWYYKSKKTVKTEKILEEKAIENISINDNNKKEETIYFEDKPQENNKQNNFNIFKSFLVLIISLVAVLIIIDTFKSQIQIIYPGIDNFLNGLYQVLQDVILFFKDLLK